MSRRLGTGIFTLGFALLFLGGCGGRVDGEGYSGTDALLEELRSARGALESRARELRGDRNAVQLCELQADAACASDPKVCRVLGSLTAAEREKFRMLLLDEAFLEEYLARLKDTRITIRLSPAALLVDGAAVDARTRLAEDGDIYFDANRNRTKASGELAFQLGHEFFHKIRWPSELDPEKRFIADERAADALSACLLAYRGEQAVFPAPASSDRLEAQIVRGHHWVSFQGRLFGAWSRYVPESRSMRLEVAVRESPENGTGGWRLVHRPGAFMVQPRFYVPSDELLQSEPEENRVKYQRFDVHRTFRKEDEGDHRPFLIEFRGRLYVFFRKNLITRAYVFNGNLDAPQWAPVDNGRLDSVELNGAGGTAPRAVVLNGKLYAIFIEQNGAHAHQARVVVYDGNDEAPRWRPVDGWDGHKGLNSSALVNAHGGDLAVFEGKLYAQWTENGRLRLAVFNGDETRPNWAFVEGAAEGLLVSELASGGRFAVLGARLVTAWNERLFGRTVIRVAAYNGNDSAPAWERLEDAGDPLSEKFPNVKQRGIRSDDRLHAESPEPVVINGRLYLSFIEYGDASNQPRRRARLAVYHGNQRWAFVDGSQGLNTEANCDADRPVLVVRDNAEGSQTLFVSWRERHRTQESQSERVYLLKVLTASAPR